MVSMEEQPGIREIDSVEELRALADPVRLAILSALDMHVPGGELPVMSVKELAQHLGEPQTKLYRHVKQLEAAGLVEVAATRMVSGILEQRYRARRPERGGDPIRLRCLPGRPVRPSTHAGLAVGRAGQAGHSHLPRPDQR